MELDLLCVRKGREFPGLQWLGLGAFTAEGLGSISGRGTKISQPVWCGQNNNTKKKDPKNRKDSQIGSQGATTLRRCVSKAWEPIA